jgi:hypothetical protein
MPASAGGYENVTRSHRSDRALGVEPTYSAREAALLLGRSYSWMDQRVRGGQFTLPDGTVVRPFRTPGGYRRLTLAMLRDIATCDISRQFVREWVAGLRTEIDGTRHGA